MDKKKTLIIALLTALCCMQGWVFCAEAQTPASFKFCDRNYEYGIGNDSIRLYFNVYESTGKRISNLNEADFSQFLTLEENGVPVRNAHIHKLNTGVRIPKDMTFSILLDQSIPDNGKRRIMKAVKEFIAIAPDSSVYVSLYGDEVSRSIMASKASIPEIERRFLTASQGKTFYSGVYAKLAEFAPGSDVEAVKATDYLSLEVISKRAVRYPGKNILMVFAEGSRRPDDEVLDILSVNNLQARLTTRLPKVYAFYYTADGEDPNIKTTLDIISTPCDSLERPIDSLKGMVLSSGSMNDVLASFQTMVEDAAFDYVAEYKVPEDNVYSGGVEYSASWGNTVVGEGKFTVGSAERPWPERPQSSVSIIVELIVAVLVTVVTFGFFFLILKIVVPYIRFLTFKSRYYRKYEPEANVQRRICHYCKQDLKPGQVIVTKCNHWMHKHCWEENGYKCAEFGQNCKTGIQEHIDWKEVFSLRSFKDCSQTIAGIIAGLVSWIIFEVCGRGGFAGLAHWIVSLVFGGDPEHYSLIQDCEVRSSAFLMIGMLLGFFISLVFRYKDDIRNKSWKIWLKIIGLSVLTAAVGILAFAIGAFLFCLILKVSGATFIPWYCSLPAYILFSIFVSLALTIKSTIPVKSALLGGCLSALIGFIVLYFTKFTSARYEWLNMLLDFIIYGGGLGASLVTVRMLAEKYFLVIQNGVKAGQRIPIHKWMNATGGGNKVSIGMTGECEIQMNWEKSNKVAKEHVQLYIDHERNLPVIKPLASGVLYNVRAELPVNKPSVLSNGDTFRIGDTIFKYEEA